MTFSPCVVYKSTNVNFKVQTGIHLEVSGYSVAFLFQALSKHRRCCWVDLHSNSYEGRFIEAQYLAWDRFVRLEC